MKINEFAQAPKTYICTVRVVLRDGITTARTTVTAENPSQARAIATRLFGDGNVLNVSEVMRESATTVQIQARATNGASSVRFSRPQQEIDSVQASSVLESGANTRVLSPQELQVKSLADKAAQYKQQAKQLKARQAVQKAEERLRKASLPSSGG